MKTTTAHLPRRKRKELDQIVGIARAVVPGLEMVVLYGSYARGDYVDYDEREEFGVRTTFVSDYDLLMVTSKSVPADLDYTYSEKIDQVFYRDKNEWYTPILQIIFEDIETVNAEIARRQYFYSDIKREGIMLWDSGRYKLARRRTLDYVEIGRFAKEHFEEKIHTADLFLHGAKEFYRMEEYAMCSFHLHQATENFYKAILLTFTLYAPKHHSLKKLRLSVRPHRRDAALLFPCDTKAEKELFDLLCRAYTEARYNPKFAVGKEEIETLMSRVGRLHEITGRACRERLEYYGKMTAKKNE